MRNRMIIIVFIIFISFFGLGYIFMEQREFSEMENRYLTLRPDFTWKNYISGEYTKTFESYTADQILGKDLFVKGNVAVNRCFGITEINQVYIGKDGYLIQDYQEPDTILAENLNYMKLFAAENPDVTMTLMLAPNANEIYPERLPAFATTYPQAEVINQIQTELNSYMNIVDVTGALQEHKEEEIYYKTDHHWTSLGAYYAYEELCKALQIEAIPLEQYQQLEITEAFYGSLYSKVPIWNQESDTVELLNNSEGEYAVTYVTENQTTDSMLDMAYAQRKDKYSVFFGGNHPLTIIESNASNKEKVLIIKDSYANCIVPLLADQFSEIHMMDLRYYHEDVSEYIEEQGIQKVIFIHNVDFISTDNNFLWL